MIQRSFVAAGWCLGFVVTACSSSSGGSPASGKDASTQPPLPEAGSEASTDSSTTDAVTPTNDGGATDAGENDVATSADSAMDAASTTDAPMTTDASTTEDASEGGAVGPIAWWKGDGNANDSTGSYNGTVQGPVTYTTGHDGQAFSLNGSSTYISVPDGIIPAATQNFTVSAWIWAAPLGLGKAQTIFSAGSKSGEFLLSIMDNGAPAFIIYGPSQGLYGAYQSSSVVASTWEVVTGVRRGSTVELWVSGTMINEVSIPGNVSAYTVTGGTSSAIGATMGAASAYSNWDGYLDDIRIFNYALSPVEIGQL